METEAEKNFLIKTMMYFSVVELLKEKLEGWSWRTMHDNDYFGYGTEFLKDPFDKDRKTKRQVLVLLQKDKDWDFGVQVRAMVGYSGRGVSIHADGKDGIEERLKGIFEKLKEGEE